MLLLIGKFVNKHANTKEKTHKDGLTGIGVQHIGCPHCNHPNEVFPPTKKYKEVRYQECEDKEGETDHNLKRQIKCVNCHKKFEFYWCTGHTYIEGVGKRRKFGNSF